MHRFNIFLPILAASVLLFSCEKPGSGTSENEGEGNKPKPVVPQVPELPKPQFAFECSPVGRDNRVDELVELKFSSPVSLGTKGGIRIYNSNGRVVDSLRIEDVLKKNEKLTAETLYDTSMDVLGGKTVGRYRIVHYDPVKIDGNTVSIQLHSCVLDFGSEYKIEIDQSCFVNDDFKGVKAGEWLFATAAKPSSDSELNVPGDFRSIQTAVNYAYECGQNKAVTINIAKGTYNEALYIRENNKITFKGESKRNTSIEYYNYEELNSGVGAASTTKPIPGRAVTQSGGRAVILIENSDDIVFENLTLKNTIDRPGQAEVIYNNDSNGSRNITFKSCNLYSLQDTFNTKGYAWFYDCLIAGDVDFIWGSPKVCLFENCEIRAMGDGYIVQSRAMSATDPGFVFLNCTIKENTSGLDGKMYLARSSGASQYFDNVAYINCKMSNVIPAVGWHTNRTPNPSKASAVSGWKEYGTTDLSGNKLSTSSRATCSYQLSDAEYEQYYKDRTTIFSSCPDKSWLNE